MFPPVALEPVLRPAGWFPGRQIAIPSNIPAAHPAAAVLSSLSGLVIPEQKPDEDGIRHQLVCFEPVPHKDDLAMRWEAELDTLMVGIGETENRHGILYMDARGRLFGSSGMHRAFWFEGADFEDAMHRLLNHVRVRPMLLPGDASIIVYGNCFVHGDPEILTPAMLRDDESIRPFG